MPFRATEMHFYHDGLSHENTLLESDDPNECFQRLVDDMASGAISLGRVVEIDANGKWVWEELPYPRIKEPEAPAFYYDYFRQNTQKR